MIYGSVCSGIEAATVAWHPLGWSPAFFAEIEPFCCSLLKERYPDVHNHGDFTRIETGEIDLLVGGTPCQDFSIAGLRAGMDGARGNLTLGFVSLAGRLRPRWLVWENVPGVLSIDGGRAFGSLLGALAQLGYGFAYRVLDAQYFGVPQRRRRVFVVGCLGDWRRAAAVLFERQSLSGDSAPSREKGEEVAACLGTGFGKRGGGVDGIGAYIPVVSGCLGGGSGSRGWCDDLDRCGAFIPTAMCLNAKWRSDGTVDTLIPDQMGVRRLTPTECERLQGFPDGYTLIRHKGKLAADGPRYRAIGNSMAVPVMRWIGQRIQEVEQIQGE